MNMNSKNKKGVEMSLNVIIIAAIGLLILLILAFLVVRSGGNVSETTTKSCVTQAGVCGNTPCEQGKQITSTSDCKTSPNTYCCKIV